MLFVLWSTATQPLIVFFENMYFQLEYCFLWCSLFWLACWQTSLFVASTLFHFGLCTPQVSISCHSAVFRDSVDSFEDQVGLGLCPSLMDKYLWNWDDLSSCGGTLPRNVRVVWSRLDSGSVAVGTRGTTASLGPIAGLAEVPLDIGFLRNVYPSQWTSAHCCWHPSIWCTTCFASFTGAWRKSFAFLGEAGEWVFRDFKSLLYGSFEASFLAVQAYLTSAMITPVFLVPDNDVLRVPFPCYFTMVKCALVLVFLVLGRGSCSK